MSNWEDIEEQVAVDAYKTTGQRFIASSGPVTVTVECFYDVRYLVEVEADKKAKRANDELDKTEPVKYIIHHLKKVLAQFEDEA